jgi:hypothetical protein
MRSIAFRFDDQIDHRHAPTAIRSCGTSQDDFVEATRAVSNGSANLALGNAFALTNDHELSRWRLSARYQEPVGNHNVPL